MTLMTEIMKQRFRIYRRLGTSFYLFDCLTKKRESLQTSEKAVALRLLHAKNEAHQQPIINRQIARAYLAASDPAINQRTWQVVMAEIIKTKHDSTLERWQRAEKDKAFNPIRNVPVFETRAEHFLRVLELGSVATNVFLRRMHNFALDMGWLAVAVIPKRQWPKVVYGPKRAITADEHNRIVAREKNEERRRYYELCWHLGGAQGDVAHLHAEDINWEMRVVSYRRKKTASVALLHFGDEVAAILANLPTSGPLFPYIGSVRTTDRATEFKQRCTGLGISGITLHSYRYAWAERAKQCGYPERYAQEALGHNSKAVHRAYARNAKMILPSLESFERKALEDKILHLPTPRPSDSQRRMESQIIPTDKTGCGTA